MRTKADAERWHRQLWNLMTDIERAEGEHMDSDLHAAVRLAWKESYREVESIKKREQAGWSA